MTQVSHHPPISAFYFADLNQDVKFWGQAEMGLSFRGNSIVFTMDGCSKLAIGLEHAEAVAEDAVKDNAMQRRMSDDEATGKQQPLPKLQESTKPMLRMRERTRPQLRIRGNTKQCTNVTSQTQTKEAKEDELAKGKEIYEFIPQCPRQIIRGILLGKKKMRTEGVVNITCKQTGYKVRLHFLEEVTQKAVPVVDQICVV